MTENLDTAVIDAVNQFVDAWEFGVTDEVTVPGAIEHLCQTVCDRRAKMKAES